MRWSDTTPPATKWIGCTAQDTQQRCANIATGTALAVSREGRHVCALLRRLDVVSQNCVSILNLRTALRYLLSHILSSFQPQLLLVSALLVVTILAISTSCQRMLFFAGSPYQGGRCSAGRREGSRNPRLSSSTSAHESKACAL